MVHVRGTDPNVLPQNPLAELLCVHRSHETSDDEATVSPGLDPRVGRQPIGHRFGSCSTMIQSAKHPTACREAEQPPLAYRWSDAGYNPSQTEPPDNGLNGVVLAVHPLGKLTNTTRIEQMLEDLDSS